MTLPQELLDVQEALEQCSIERPHAMARRFLEASLLRATAALMHVEEFEVHQYLTTQWLSQFAYYINKGGISELLAKELDTFIEYAATKNTVVATAKMLDGGKLLACVCLARVNLRVSGYVHPKTKHVGDVLTNLTGEQPPDLALRDMEAAIDMLYGPSCWSLYRDDVVQESKLPEYLLQLGVPLFRENKRLYTEPDTRPNLPHDM